MNHTPHSFIASPVSRREALKRAAAILGVAITPSLLSNVLRAQTSAGGARYLNKDQFATVAALVERILPRTDTPGALDVGVPAFIDQMYGEFQSPDEKSALESAITAFEKSAMTAHQAGFAQLSAGQQDGLLLAAAESTSDRKHFLRIRELAIVGYFTSETVGREVLHYDPIPSRYEGCVPIDEVGNISWTSR